MEQIERRDGILYYGGKVCVNPDDAYKRFRDDYNASLGKRYYQRLGRLGSRKERVHGFGFVFDNRGNETQCKTGVHNIQKSIYPTRLLGISAGAYCRMLGGWDIQCGDDEEEFWRLFDRIFTKGSGMIRLTGRRDKAGRTSKMLKKRFR